MEARSARIPLHRSPFTDHRSPITKAGNYAGLEEDLRGHRARAIELLGKAVASPAGRVFGGSPKTALGSGAPPGVFPPRSEAELRNEEGNDCVRLVRGELTFSR